MAIDQWFRELEFDELSVSAVTGPRGKHQSRVCRTILRSLRAGPIHRNASRSGAGMEVRRSARVAANVGNPFESPFAKSVSTISVGFKTSVSYEFLTRYVGQQEDPCQAGQDHTVDHHFRARDYE